MSDETIDAKAKKLIALVDAELLGMSPLDAIDLLLLLRDEIEKRMEAAQIAADNDAGGRAG